jgi:hypothetical protein
MCGVLQGCMGWSGCEGADFRALGITEASRRDSDIADRLGRRPGAAFPAVIAAMRIQGPGWDGDGQGATGRTRIVTLRDVEQQDDFDRFARLPMVSAVVPVNGMAAPRRVSSEGDLRAAAAMVHADLALLYTISTRWNTETTIPVIGLLTLGIFPNQMAKVTSTAAAALVDVRTGYVYALAESTDKQEQLANGWTSGSAEQQARRRAERKAFEGMMGELEGQWKRVADHYAATPPPRVEYVVVPARPLPPPVEPGWERVPRGEIYKTR